MIDLDPILSESVRFEVYLDGELVRWGDCSRRDVFMQARDGEVVEMYELAATATSL